MENPFKSASHIEQEPEQNLSDLQFVASLQHQIDELQSLINNDVLNVLRQDCYREHIKVNTISNHEIVDSFIIGEFIEYQKLWLLISGAIIFSMTHFITPLNFDFFFCFNSSINNAELSLFSIIMLPFVAHIHTSFKCRYPTMFFRISSLFLHGLIHYWLYPLKTYWQSFCDS